MTRRSVSWYEYAGSSYTSMRPATFLSQKRSSGETDMSPGQCVLMHQANEVRKASLAA